MKQLFIASNFKQLSADNKINNYKIKTSFVGPEMLMAWANKTGLNFMIFLDMKKIVI